MMARLKHGPCANAVLMVQDNCKWLYIRYTGPVTTETQTAAWPHDEPPTGRPPLEGPLLCYRLVSHNTETGKAEFEFDEKHSDEIELIVTDKPYDTHAACDACWHEKRGTPPDENTPRRLRGLCCYCRSRVTTGLTIRDHLVNTSCEGNHEWHA